VYSQGHALTVICELLDDVDHTQRNLTHLFHIEILQTLLDTMEFGRTNGAYLVRENGYWRLDYRNLITKHVSCPIFAPLIDEDDIEITWWHGRWVEYRRGKWNGEEVDLYVASNDYSAGLLMAMTRGYHALQGMNVTVKVLGHVVRGKSIIGIMMERLVGRELVYADRSLVYQGTTVLVTMRRVLMCSLQL
jgi:hypothetical protein